VRKSKIALLLVIAVVALALSGCACVPDEESIQIVPPGHPVVVGEPAQFSVTKKLNEFSQEFPAFADWTIKDNPGGASIGYKTGLFVATTPGVYTIEAVYNVVSARYTVTVGPKSSSADSSASATASDGVSFSVDEPSPASGGNVGALAGTYEGTMPLIFGSQKADVPFTFTVDSAGKVSGSFEHAWKPMNGIQSTVKATFSGTVSADGKLTATGTTTNSGTNQGQPYSTAPYTIPIGGQVTGTQFVGGISGQQDWKAERK
jgi:hypothetical protein